MIFFCGDKQGLVQQLVLEYADSRVVTATRKHECRPGENCAGILSSTRVDISVNVNPFEVAMNPELNELSESMVLAHVFSPALTSLTFGKVEKKRPVDAGLMGAVNENYPLRDKWSELAIEKKPRHKVVQYERPKTFQDRQDDKESWMQHFNAYASKLRKVKILLTDAAWVFYSVQKYSEAPTAGAVLVADIPHDRMREFRHAGVEVSTAMDVAQLRSTLDWWLDRPDDLTAKALTGQKWALHHVQTTQFFEQTTELYYDRMEEEYGGQGTVGRVFPSPFYIRCRGAGGEQWCKKGQFTKLPHYLIVAGEEAERMPRHPAFGGPVPLVTRPSGCSETGEIAPHAYKARWGAGTRALRVLLLQQRQTGGATDTLYPRLVRAVEAGYQYIQPLTIWGPGYDGYDQQHALAANIAARFGHEDHFDMIVTTGGTLGAETAIYKERRTVVVVRRTNCVIGADSPQFSGESQPDQNCEALLSAHRPSIVLLGNPFELLYNDQLTNLSTDALMVHTPRVGSQLERVHFVGSHAAMGELRRATDVLLVRKPDGPSHPLHGRWKQVAEQLRQSGYTVEEYTVGAAPSVELFEKMQQAKMVLTESTSRRYMPPEWEDALTAGCLVLSDMPAERMREFRRFSVPVRREAPAADLVGTVEKWFHDTATREEKTMEGARWAVQNASPEHYLDDLMESYWEVVKQPYGEGLVGKKFPWSFQASCRSDGGERWCKPPKKKIRPHWSK